MLLSISYHIRKVAYEQDDSAIVASVVQTLKNYFKSIPIRREIVEKIELDHMVKKIWTNLSSSGNPTDTAPSDIVSAFMDNDNPVRGSKKDQGGKLYGRVIFKFKDRIPKERLEKYVKSDYLKTEEKEEFEKIQGEIIKFMSSYLWSALTVKGVSNWRRDPLRIRTQQEKKEIRPDKDWYRSDDAPEETTTGITDQFEGKDLLEGGSTEFLDSAADSIRKHESDPKNRALYEMILEMNLKYGEPWTAVVEEYAKKYPGEKELTFGAFNFKKKTMLKWLKELALEQGIKRTGPSNIPKYLEILKDKPDAQVSLKESIKKGARGPERSEFSKGVLNLLSEGETVKDIFRKLYPDAELNSQSKEYQNISAVKNQVFDPAYASWYKDWVKDQDEEEERTAYCRVIRAVFNKRRNTL